MPGAGGRTKWELLFNGCRASAEDDGKLRSWAVALSTLTMKHNSSVRVLSTSELCT